ncbi:GNAT family N-acetyltransferase [Pseudooceanicola nitratireducens]|uniref:GNAT family N-acetyltransferase n=1 Tax=Pseudooceanicola nitratireducens TaxID=517719 RepID=UPI0035181C6F
MSRLVIRDGEPLDAGATGAILGQSVRDHRWMPQLYSEAENIAHLGRLIDLGWVRVAVDGVIRGFLAREGAYVHALYVARGARGSGIGRRLIEDAKAQVDQLELHTFEANAGARRFYLRMGFAEAERSDGARNDEGLPDIRYVWQAGRDATSASRQRTGASA